MEWISGNVFIRPNELPVVGDLVDGHKHNFDHTTIVFTGAVHVRAKLPDGSVREGDFKAPSHFLVRKDGVANGEFRTPSIIEPKGH